MFSWFPIFFPLKLCSWLQHPVPVCAGQCVELCFWRRAAPQKVWYEWAVTRPHCSALHNPNGRSYTIGL
ncbi:UNVERIFIED_CONTAM: hypothetical protein H355_011856 [Colinus virginianus]|nr:hypothetical protein H355_011856 [Colinus virginianus]